MFDQNGEWNKWVQIMIVYIAIIFFFPQDWHHLNKVGEFCVALGGFIPIYIYTTWEVWLR